MSTLCTLMRQRLLSRKPNWKNFRGQTKEFEIVLLENEPKNDCSSAQRENNIQNERRKKKYKYWAKKIYICKKNWKKKPKMVCEKAMFSPCHKYRTQCIDQVLLRLLHLNYKKYLPNSIAVSVHFYNNDLNEVSSWFWWMFHDLL